MTTNKGRVDHLDSMLTGLAMFDAYVRRDTESLTSMVEATPPGEAVEGLLASMEIMCGIFATQVGINPEQITASVRRRIIHELGAAPATGV